MKIETVPVGDLAFDPMNARRHDEANLKAIAGSLELFGQRKPIVVTEAGVVVAGNGTLQAAKSLGWSLIDVVRVPGDWSDDQVKAFALADNRSAELASWDEQVMASQLLELEAAGFDLAEFGFEAVAPEPVVGSDDEGELPEPPVEAKSKVGQVYKLGRHRLMCGDATDEKSVVKLVDGLSVDMVFTDPPYGISHSGKGITANGVEGNDFGEILGDSDVTIAIDSFQLMSKLFSDKRIIFWGANYYPSALPNGYGWIVWDKVREGDTFSGAELAFVNQGVKLRIFEHMWHGMVKASEHGQKRVHPTQKPTALAKWCFENYGNPDVVLDIFGGSGSTLIACEQTDKTCLMMELDPKYIDVIITRWETLTGLKAELVS